MSKESKQERFDKREQKRAITNAVLWGAFLIIVVGGIFWVASSSKGEPIVATKGNLDQITAEDHILGDLATAKVQLVEYSDFECPACAGYEPIIKNITNVYVPQGLVFVYRHFPLTQHLRALPASRASEAASNQGKFWEMHEKIFATQSDWTKLSFSDTKELFFTFAKDLGLNMTKFETDYNSDEVMDRIQRDLLSGRKVDIPGTPTFFLNGEEINPRTEADFIKLIDDALKTYDETNSQVNSATTSVDSR